MALHAFMFPKFWVTLISMASNTKGGGKKGSKKDGVGGGLVCAHCKKAGGLGTMKCCGRCKRVNYCSVECQKGHWKLGGHKKVCGKRCGSGARSDGVPATPLKHPCPICLDTEDNAGEEPGMCFSCGQMFCDSCNLSFEQHVTTHELPDMSCRCIDQGRCRRCVSRGGRAATAAAVGTASW
jgi:hypothetical protein